MLTIIDKQKKVVEDFSILETQFEKYEIIIEIGKESTSLEDDLKKDCYLVKGCTSMAWLVSEYKDGKLYFKVDSDSIFVKGLMAILINVYQGHSPKEILSHPPDFLLKAGIMESISSNRANGLNSLIRLIMTTANKYNTDLKT